MAVGTPMRWRKAQIGAKLEAVEGTAIAITNAEAKIKAENISLSYDLPFYSRENTVSASMSKFTGTLAGPRTGTLSFDVPVAGSGTKDTAPGWGVLLVGCGFDEVVTGSTSTAYTPESVVTAGGDGGSITIKLFVDGKAYILHGARGNVRFLLPTGMPMRLNFTFQGIYNDPVDLDLLTITHETTVPPALVNGSFTLDSYAYKASNLEIDMQNTLSLRPDASATQGGFSFVIAGRNPVGTLDPEETAAATKNIWTIALANTEGALTYTIGATTGNLWTLTAPKVQLRPGGLGDRDGMVTNTLALEFNRNSGDDEIAFTQT